MNSKIHFLIKNYRYVISAVVLLLNSYSISHAQVMQEWVQRYNGPGNNLDLGNSVAADGSGNVYVTGASDGSGTSTDFATIKYNSAGAQQWIQRYNGPGNLIDQALSIAVDASGNVYVTGYSRGAGTGDDYATIKYNSAGVQQWIQRYNGPGNDGDFAGKVTVDGSGNVYVTGFSRGAGTGDDLTTVKYNSAGVQQWVQRYNGPGNSVDNGRSVVVDASGNVYVAGGSYGTSHDFTTIKYNSSGVQQWVQRYNGPGNGFDEAYEVEIGASGNIYVTGYGPGSGTFSDYLTIKYNSSGIFQWEARYDAAVNLNDYAYSITLDINDNVYVTGGSYGTGTSSDYATVKYNSSGIQQWVQRYNGPGNDFDAANSITIDGSGNLYVTGRSNGSGSGEDFATLKYNSSGTELWVQRYNGPGNSADAAGSIAVDASGNVYITGKSIGSGTGNDYSTIKYSQPMGIHLTSGEVPESFSLSQNYPNPFNPSTKIRLQIPKSSFVNIVVFDVLGKEITTLVNEKLAPGTYEADWNASYLSSGTYFYKLTTESYSQTRKMILIK